MVLWALTLLAVFAVQIGLMTRDKISFLARAERQSILRSAAKGGISKALAMIEHDKITNKERNPLQTKMEVYYNPSAFRDLDFGPAVVSVIHSEDEINLYGVTDEAGRLNLNFAKRDQIRKLLIATGAGTEDNADKIASAIYDWHTYGESEIEGFSSETSYDNLQYPYPAKKANFEILDELRLVQGVNEDVFARLINYVTIYGSEGININTVSWPVLASLGLTEEQAKMVETIRRGVDTVAGTLDDTFFEDSGVLFQSLKQALGLPDEDAEPLAKTLKAIPFVTAANLFRIHSTARLVSRKENKSITCVFDTNGDKITYWREQ